MPTTRPTPAEAALHALVCNAYGYDKSIVRAAALRLRQMAIIGPGLKELAERLLEAEEAAGRVSRCDDVHPLPKGPATAGPTGRRARGEGGD
jgi:hypothetical protein